MNRQITATKIMEIIASTFDVDISTLSEITSADDVDGWDSLAHATLLIRIEKKLNIDLDMEAACQAQNVGMLIEVCHNIIKGSAQ